MSTKPWGGRKATRTLAAVLNAYGHVCWLCHRPIVFGLRPRHPLGPSADHVLARHRGGSDDIANLRPAHFGCNASKGDRLAPASQSRPVERHPGFS